MATKVINQSINFIGIKEISFPLYVFLNIISLGAFYTVCRLSKTFKIMFYYSECNLEIADSVILEDQYKNMTICPIKIIKIKPTLGLARYIESSKFYGKEDKNFVRILETPYSRFIYDYKLRLFVAPPFSIPCIKNVDEYIRDLLQKPLIEEETEIYEKRIIYGGNSPRVPQISLLTIIGNSFFEVIFLWEMVSTVLWLAIEFYKYAFVTGSIFLFAFFKNIFDEYINRIPPNEPTTVRVFRNGRFKEVDEDEVFPGDIICIDKTDNFKCDVEILKGDVITDESFLTGETVPICKGINQLVFSGTKIIKSTCGEETVKFSDSNSKRLQKFVKVRNLISKDTNTSFSYNEEYSENYKENNQSAIGIVVKTGKRTKRGNLIKNMQIRNNPNNIFTIQSKSVIQTLMGSSAICSLGYIIYLSFYLPPEKVFEFSSDLFMTLFSPSLYTCLNLGIIHAQNGLISKSIKTTDRNRITTAGEVDVVIFDKTGTLTEIGLDIYLIDSINQKSKNFEDLSIFSKIGISSCHTVLELDGEYSGDILDMKMFVFSNSKIITEGKRRFIKIGQNPNKDFSEVCREYSPIEYITNINEEEKEKLQEGYTTIFTTKNKRKMKNLNNLKSNKFMRRKLINSRSCIKNIQKSVYTQSNDNLLLNNTKSIQSNNLLLNNSNIFEEIEILRTFEFNSFDKRMSVIVQLKNGKKYVICKGASECLKKILKEVPNKYDKKIHEYAIAGHRVISMAYAEIDSSIDIFKMKREYFEKDLIFETFIVFANQLKAETESVISELNNANISTRMCTGDNILTAISVARECSMISKDIPVLFPLIDDTATSYLDAEWLCIADEDLIFDKIKMCLFSEFDKNTECDFLIAIEGKEYEIFKDTIYHKLIIEKGIIFARFNPENKKELIEDIVNTGLTTMFCGDGANDSGALSAADVGLSLAENEASLIAPFNSPNLSSVLDLIKEGRSALAMGIGQFKYIFYSQLIAGLQMAALLPYLYFPSDGMSLLNDLLSCYALGYSLTMFKCSKTISPKKIQVNLPGECFTILMELLVIFLIYCISLVYCGSSTSVDEIEIESEHSTVIFITTLFLFIYKAVFFADFGEYREKRFKNIKFISMIILSLIIFVSMIGFIIYEQEWIVEQFEFVHLENKYKKIALFCFLGAIITTTIFNQKENIKSI